MVLVHEVVSLLQDLVVEEAGDSFGPVRDPLGLEVVSVWVSALALQLLITLLPEIFPLLAILGVVLRPPLCSTPPWASARSTHQLASLLAISKQFYYRSSNKLHINLSFSDLSC